MKSARISVDVMAFCRDGLGWSREEQGISLMVSAKSNLIETYEW